MAMSMKGLRIKPTYEQLIGVAVSGDLEHTRSPNRNASFLRKWFYSVTKLDGEGMRQMERQQEIASKESYKEHLLKGIAKNTANTHDLRNDSHQEMRTERVEEAVHFDMAQGDDDVDVTMTQTTGVSV